MNHRLYALVTRSAALLIVALLAAPVWDAWRHRGLASSGAAVFPVGAILSGPQRSPDRPMARVPDATGPSEALSAVPGGGAPGATRDPAGAVPAPAPLDSGAPPSRSRYEAWSAHAQVDPFWDGVVGSRPSATAPADPAGDRSSADRAHDAAPAPADRAAPGVSSAALSSGSRATAADDRHSDADGGPRTGARGGQGAPAAQAVRRPGVPQSIEATPSLAPEPVEAPVTGTPRILPGAPVPDDPAPVTVPVPLVSALVSTPDVAPSDTILVTIRIEDADRMTSLPFHLGFDPAVIEFVGSRTAPTLAALEPILLASVSPNRPGDVAVGLSLVEMAGVFTGTGDLVTLEFRAVAPGHSGLTFSRATLRGARSEAVEARFADGGVTVH